MTDLHARENEWLAAANVKRERESLAVNPWTEVQHYCQLVLLRYVTGEIDLVAARAFCKGATMESRSGRYLIYYRQEDRVCWLCGMHCFAHRRCECCEAPWYDPTQRRPLACRLALHDWDRARDTGKHGYDVCFRCGERRITELHPGGYQPVDMEWLRQGNRKSRQRKHTCM